MSTKVNDDLVLEIGSEIVKSEEYANDPWVGITVVGDFSHGQQSMSGYAYMSNGGFAARIPSFNALRKIRSLRQEMKKEKDEEWHQCLIHITQPDYKINIKFEYDDPDRWTPKTVSRDMSDYAESIKPPTL